MRLFSWLRRGALLPTGCSAPVYPDLATLPTFSPSRTQCGMVKGRAWEGLLVEDGASRRAGACCRSRPLACTETSTLQTSSMLNAPPRDDRSPPRVGAAEPWVIVVRRYRAGRSASTTTGNGRGTFDKIAFWPRARRQGARGRPCTPNGLYRIVGKRPHARWTRFMPLDYPNLSDRDDHRRALEEGSRPPDPAARSASTAPTRERFNQLGIDWTFGCVSLMNDDVVELYEMVPTARSS